MSDPVCGCACGCTKTEDVSKETVTMLGNGGDIHVSESEIARCKDCRVWRLHEPA